MAAMAPAQADGADSLVAAATPSTPSKTLRRSATPVRSVTSGRRGFVAARPVNIKAVRPPR